MSAAQPSPSKVENRRERYTAALFESDGDRVPKRIADAEQTIVVRARELFLTGSDTIEEDQALGDALDCPACSAKLSATASSNCLVKNSSHS
jgi:hypothetical protein